MSVYNKTPMARKAAWSYCRRCLVVMLCCVLAFGLTVPAAPRAKAAGIVDGTSAVDIAGWTVIEGGASGGASPSSSGITGSTIGAFLLAASGVNMLVDSIDYTTTRYYGGAPYEKGNELWAYLYDLGEDIGAWCMGVDSRTQDAGGIRSGDSFDVPASVLEATRQWAVGNMAFVDGVLPYNEYVLQGDFGVVALFNVDFSALNNYSGSSAKEFGLPVLGAGTTFGYPALDYTQSQSVSYLIGDNVSLSVNYKVSGNYVGVLSGNICGHSMQGGSFTRDSLAALSGYVSGYIGSVSRYGIAYNPAKNAYYGGAFLDDGMFWTKTSSKVTASEAPATISTLFTATPALDEPKTEELTITIPPQLPTTQVGELTIPVITEITSTDLTEIGGENNPSVNPTPGTGITPGQITEAVKDALPITGSQLGDEVIEETTSNPYDLGGVFISKFPFSIPWDIYKFFSLLAAEPVTPHWEIDFYAPLEGLGGFHAQGDTTLVIDFGSLEFMGQVCRWTCMAGFVYALASGTKKLIWTA